ncbi:hypothetical protein OH77DRAFT_21138 [Trametes cingulata]|nr:hypothetical protein OH77DRAFT_21138 [Trametes cingulata]
MLQRCPGTAWSMRIPSRMTKRRAGPSLGWPLEGGRRRGQATDLILSDSVTLRPGAVIRLRRRGLILSDCTWRRILISGPLSSNARRQQLPRRGVRTQKIHPSLGTSFLRPRARSGLGNRHVFRFSARAFPSESTQPPLISIAGGLHDPRHSPSHQHPGRACQNGHITRGNATSESVTFPDRSL